MYLNKTHKATRRFGGRLEEVLTAYSFTGAVDTVRVDVGVGYGNSLTLRNGRIDKLHFDEGYCLASEYPGNTSQDNFAFCYFNLDHLGSIRQVVRADRTTNGTVFQTMNYYPFGAQFCNGSPDSDAQSRRYNFSIEREKRKLACFSEREKNRPKVNGKELDKMHGLNTYDYGARQYNPVTARWDRVDPLCEKYYAISPYAYCMNNPVKFIDMNGMKPDSISAALMSLLAYGYDNNAYNELLTHHWSFVSHHESGSGFKFNVYKKKKDNGSFEYTCAYAGTDTDEGGEFAKDALNDVGNYFGCITPQYLEAAITALRISGEEEWTFVGHSLGGGLAALSSKLTGKDAIIFNPASLSGKVNIFASLVSLFRGGHITQYRAFGSSIFGGLLGDPVNTIQTLTGKYSQGKVIPVFVGKNCSHGIQDIIDAFHRNGKRR